jgi:NOL1/NOP2/sun family putative RNA methylase
VSPSHLVLVSSVGTRYSDWHRLIPLPINKYLHPNAKAAMPLHRYRSIIPDWTRFLAVSSTPEPTSIRIRVGRIGSDEMVRCLRDQGYLLSPIQGLPEFFHVADGPRPASQTVEHWLGLFYLQQSVMGLPSRGLQPAPNDLVLDLCAAPGGKTSHLADLMRGRGTLVAVDSKGRRITTLVGTMNRMGHANVLVVGADGRAFPEEMQFDRVLVDAPCSAEGTLRRWGGRPPPASRRFLRYITEVQEALLRRAVTVTRPGGFIVYATCTINPAENEGVVSRVLRDAPAVVDPIDWDIPHAPGVTSFEGARFDSSLAAAWRVYPHHLNSGGLFMTRLRRLPGDAERRGERPVPTTGSDQTPMVAPGAAVTPEEAGRRINLAIRCLREEFGLTDESLEGLRWTVRGRSVWVHRCDHWPPGAWTNHRGWTLDGVGLPGFRRDMQGAERPTAALLRWLDGKLRRRVVPISPSDCLELLRGRSLAGTRLADGFVALSLGRRVIGRGRVSGGRLRHELPRAQARSLAAILTV